MANPVEAEKYLQFQLSELAGSNAHHVFEEICVRVARRRISANILLATGPVSAGGDQARDGESYFTRLPTELPGAGGFAAEASSDPVAVACTLQKSALDAKFKLDAATICGSGQPVAHIAFFCVQSVPVAKQHAWQQHARDEHGVSADIFDGPRLACLLAERDLIWIAEQYLHLPAAMVPDYADSQTLPEWYTRDLQALRARDRQLTSAGDLATVRDGLRHATFNDEARADLPEWLAFAGQLASAGRDGTELGRDIAARAKYEIVVASLRGLNRLEGVEPLADDFFKHATRSDNVGIVEDASVLLMYCGGAWARHLGTLTAAGLHNQAARLRSHVDALLARTDPDTFPIRYGQLLAAAAHLRLHPQWDEADRPEPGKLPEPQATSRLVRDARATGILPRVPAGAVGSFDVAPAMERLDLLAGHLPKAPGLPIESLCDIFEMLTPALAVDPRYGRIRDALDSAVAALEGGSAVADRCRGRALSFARAGQPLQALREFHDAKVNWWHGDTLRGSLLAMRFIARLYSELRLPHAAKQYSLAAATVASASNRPDLIDLIPSAFGEAADYMYIAGAWLDATAMVGLTRLAHAHLAEHAFDDDEHPELASMEFNQTTTLLAARSFRPALLPWIEQSLGATGYDEHLTAMADAVTGSFAYAEANFVELSDDQLVGRPFSDSGATRGLAFSALGLDWQVDCKNERAAVLAAERFAGAVQILLAEVALHDPVFVHAPVRVKVSTDAPLDRSAAVRLHHGNDGVSATVYLEPHTPDNAIRLSEEVVSHAVYLLVHLSLRPYESFMALLEGPFERGLLHKISTGRPYDETADLFGDEHYAELAALPASTLGPPDHRPHPSEHVPRPSSAGPGYDCDTEIDRIAERYDYLPSLLSQTLPRLAADPVTRRTLTQLRTEGWLDWHLLLAVHNIAMNARLRYERVDMRDLTPSGRERMVAVAKRPEEAESPPIPLEFFDRAAFDLQLITNTVGMLNRFGLQCHLQTPPDEAILAVLRERYGYWTDDAPHPPFFWSDGQAD